MSYGYNERWEFEQLDQKYRNYSPPSPYSSSPVPPDYKVYIRLKQKFAPPAGVDHGRKELTKKAEAAEAEKRYLEAEKLWLEIAAICHKLKDEHSAYLVEHRALQCRHQQVYKDARISIRSFSGVPNLDKLQDALTDAAEKRRQQKDHATLTVCSLLNARLCHAQGKERDAFLLEESVRDLGFFDQYFVQPGRSSNNAPVEEVFLRQIAAEYADTLYPV